MSQNNPWGVIAYKYYCSKCSHHIKLIIDFEVRLKQNCPCCNELMKYQGGTDVRQSTVGNVGYVSFEKGSQENIKRVGKDGLDAMIKADPVASYRQKSAEEGKKMWWRKNLKDPSKPLDISQIKDTAKFIETGQTD